MPKQWYHWGPKSSKRKGGGGKDEGRSSSVAKPPPAVVAAAAGGCMGAVFELFNSHHLQFRLQHHRSFDPEEDGQGVEATASLSSLSSIQMGVQMSSTGGREARVPRSQAGEACCNIPVSELANSSSTINTSRRDTELLAIQVPSSKAGDGQVSSSGSRTPSLVARLMGLDPLPQGFPSSPRPLSEASPKCRRAIETLEGRRSDVDGFNRRLSLQVSYGLKEESSKLSRHSCSEVNTEKCKSSWKVGEDDENQVWCTPYYARMTMKQVSRTKFGADITNKTGELQGREQRRDEILLSSSKTKSSGIRYDRQKCHQSGPGGILSGSWTAKGQGQAPGSDKDPARQKRSFRCSLAAPQVQVQVKEQKQKPVSQNCRDAGAKVGNVGSRFKSLNPPRLIKKEEQHVHVRIGKDSEKNYRKTPFSSKLRHGNEVHSLVPLEKLGKQVVVQKKAAHQPAKPNTTKAFKPGSDSHTPCQPPPEQPTNTASTAELGFQLMRVAWRMVKGFYDSGGLGPDTDFVAWVPESDDIVGEIEKEMVDKLVLDTLVALGCYD